MFLCNIWKMATTSCGCKSQMPHNRKSEKWKRRTRNIRKFERIKMELSSYNHQQIRSSLSVYLCSQISRQLRCQLRATGELLA